MRIQSYSFGEMVVNGERYNNDLMVVGEGIKTNWYRKRGHNLYPEDINWILDRNPDLLIIGQGKSGRMRVSDGVKDLLQNQDIQFQIAATDDAVKHFNDAHKNQDSTERIAGAFHLTC